jgi:hypothetical protein
VKIYMQQSMCGPKVMRVAGAVYDIPDKEARGLIAGGFAVEATKDHEAAARLREAQSRDEPRAERAPSQHPEAETRGGKAALAAAVKPAGKSAGSKAG